MPLMWPGFPGVEFKFFTLWRYFMRGRHHGPSPHQEPKLFLPGPWQHSFQHICKVAVQSGPVMLYTMPQFFALFLKCLVQAFLFKGYSLCAHLAFTTSARIVTAQNALPWRCWHLCRTVRSVLPALTSASFSIPLKINHNKTKRLLNFIATCWQRKY